MTDQVDAEAIAAGLNWAERATLRLCHPNEWREWLDSAASPVSFCTSGRSLMSKGLIEWHPDPKITLTRLTPLGKAVRATSTLAVRDVLMKEKG